MEYMHASTRNRVIVWVFLAIALLVNIAGYAWDLYDRLELQLTDHARRVPHSKHVGRKILGYHCPGTYDRILPDGHTRTEDDAAAQPDVVSNCDRLGSLPFCAAWFCLERMRGCEKLHIRTDLHILADGDRCHVEQHSAIIDERPCPDMDMIVIVAPDRMTYLSSPAQRPEQLAEDSPS